MMKTLMAAFVGLMMLAAPAAAQAPQCIPVPAAVLLETAPAEAVKRVFTEAERAAVHKEVTGADAGAPELMVLVTLPGTTVFVVELPGQTCVFPMDSGGRMSDIVNKVIGAIS